MATSKTPAPVGVEDQHRFILQHQVMEKITDEAFLGRTLWRPAMLFCHHLPVRLLAPQNAMTVRDQRSIWFRRSY